MIQNIHTHSTTGKIQLQTLSLKAAKQICWARVISIVLAVITFLGAACGSPYIVFISTSGM